MEENKEITSWNEWSRYILKELERLNACYKDLDEKLSKLSEKLTEKNEAIHTRITLLYIKVAGVSVGVTLLSTLLFLFLSHYLGLRGKTP
jgi:hypothetical protein